MRVVHQLAVEDLEVTINQGEQSIYPIQGTSFTLPPRRMTGLVGESGSGKSMTALTLMNLLPGRGVMEGGTIWWEGEDITDGTKRDRMRGRDLAMVFQDARTSLDPLLSIGRQISDILVYNTRLKRKDAWERGVQLLDRMGIPNPRERAKDYPHQYSGGMCQRAMVAMALACSPRMLIADEPTTGLDLTIQVQVLDLISEIVRQEESTLLLISHDLAVIRDLCHQVIVMYSGQVAEAGPVDILHGQSQHPYTKALVRCLESRPGEPMADIPGRVPSLREKHVGCAFAPRCDYQGKVCWQARPERTELGEGHWAYCYLLTGGENLE